MITKEKAIEVLNIDDKVNPPFHLFKKDTILLYVGRCRKAKILVTSKGEEWVGKKDIFERQFGYIVSFVLNGEKLHIEPKIGDIVYVDPFSGELTPFEVDDEMLYFKVVKLDEINLIIK